MRQSTFFMEGLGSELLTSAQYHPHLWKYRCASTGHKQLKCFVSSAMYNNKNMHQLAEQLRKHCLQVHSISYTNARRGMPVLVICNQACFSSDMYSNNHLMTEALKIFTKFAQPVLVSDTCIGIASSASYDWLWLHLLHVNKVPSVEREQKRNIVESFFILRATDFKHLLL